MLQTKATLLKRLGKEAEGNAIMKTAVDNASALELHFYGRQLMNENKLPEALQVFQKNYDKNKGAWPTNMGMMRIYAAMGDHKKALGYAKAALPQAPDEATRKFLETAIQNLEQGKPL